MKNELIKIAAGQLGVSEPGGDDKYIRWYSKKSGVDFPLNSAWCHMFVSWCAEQAGIPADIIPVTASCTAAMNWFKRAGAWREAGSYQPKAGDLIYFDWDHSGDCDHVGIVESAYGGSMEVIEGNASGGTEDGVRRKSRFLSDSRVRGFAEPKYREAEKLSVPSEWAKEAAQWAVGKKLFQGDQYGRMDWQEPVTREMLAVVLKRLEEQLA